MHSVVRRAIDRRAPSGRYVGLTSGQGASMAIGDGTVLATALHDEDGVASAFAAFERSRRERVERIVAWGARGSSDRRPADSVGPSAT